MTREERVIKILAALDGLNGRDARTLLYSVMDTVDDQSVFTAPPNSDALLKEVAEHLNVYL